MKRNLEILAFVILLVIAPIITFGLMVLFGNFLIFVWESGPIGVGILIVAGIALTTICTVSAIKVLRKGLG